MAKNKNGVIVNIASDLALIAPDQRIYNNNGEEKNYKPITYSVIKHGIIGMTKYLSTYWLDKNIRVNALCPGGVINNQNQEFISKVTKLIPLGRLANVDEYHSAIQFLCSDASSYMTGSCLVMDGGRSVWYELMKKFLILYKNFANYDHLALIIVELSKQKGLIF